MRRFRSNVLVRDECGGTLVLHAIGMVTILGVAALTIDLGKAYVLQNKLQAAADSVALAAASELPAADAARDMAQNYANKNLDPSLHGTALRPNDVEIGEWDPSTRTFSIGGGVNNAVQVTLRRSQTNGNEVRTFFGGVLGITSIDVTASAVASTEANAVWNLVIVQDNTSSFTSEIDEARTANQALLDCLRDFSFAEPRVGLVTFTGWGRVHETVRPIHSAYDDLTSAVSALDACSYVSDPDPTNPAHCGGTNPASGMSEAITLINAAPPANPVRNGMIIVSDGRPTTYEPAQPYDGSCSGDCTSDDVRRMAVEAADTADAQGISVFSVFFDDAGDDDAAAYFESLIRGDGTFVRTDDPTDLQDLLVEICTQQPLALVK